MGVYADKFYGYFMDVKEEYERDYKIVSDMIEQYADGKINNSDFEDLKFVPYYSKNAPREGDITLLYDGMCGEYGYLILINTVEMYSDDDSPANEKVNESLKLVPVPEDIKERMVKIYNIIFGEDKEVPPIYLKQFTHYH